MKTLRLPRGRQPTIKRKRGTVSEEVIVSWLTEIKNDINAIIDILNDFEIKKEKKQK